MDTKLIIVFVVINLTFAGIIGVNGYFYYRSSEAKFKGIVKTEEENIEHFIEDYFKDSNLSKQVIGDILLDSLSIIDKNLELDFEKQQSTFVRAGKNYAITMSEKVYDDPDEIDYDFFVTRDMHHAGLIKKKIHCSDTPDRSLLQDLGKNGILAKGKQYKGTHQEDHQDLIIQVERV